LLSLGITFYVLYNVIKNLKKIFRVLLQEVPAHLSMEQLEKELESIPGVVRVYHTHLWSLEGTRNFLSTHLVIKGIMLKEEVIQVKKEALDRMGRYGIDHVTLQIDYPEEENEFHCY